MFKPEEEMKLDERGVNMLRSSIQKKTPSNFNLAPVLHYGKITRLQVDLPDVAHFCRRGANGVLLPLANPYDYYVRAALLHSAAPACQPPDKRDQLLHEARESLLAVLENGNRLNRQQPRQQFGGSPEEEGAAADPRLWYLLGLILCDLGDLTDAQVAYRQALSRLPVVNFGHVTHFNLACLQAAHLGEVACAAAVRELREFRRHCRGLWGNVPSHQRDGSRRQGGRPCSLCGAPGGTTGTLFEPQRPWR